MSSVAPFGCIVDYAPGKSGLVHVSELDVARTADPAASWKAGDKIDVKVLEYDKASGRTKLSRYASWMPGVTHLRFFRSKNVGVMVLGLQHV